MLIVAIGDTPYKEQYIKIFEECSIVNTEVIHSSNAYGIISNRMREGLFTIINDDNITLTDILKYKSLAERFYNTFGVFDFLSPIKSHTSKVNQEISAVDLLRDRVYSNIDESYIFNDSKTFIKILDSNSKHKLISDNINDIWVFGSIYGRINSLETLLKSIKSYGERRDIINIGNIFNIHNINDNDVNCILDLFEEYKIVSVLSDQGIAFIDYMNGFVSDVGSVSYKAYDTLRDTSKERISDYLKSCYHTATVKCDDSIYVASNGGIPWNILINHNFFDFVRWDSYIGRSMKFEGFDDVSDSIETYKDIIQIYTHNYNTYLESYDKMEHELYSTSYGGISLYNLNY